MQKSFTTKGLKAGDYVIFKWFDIVTAFDSMCNGFMLFQIIVFSCDMRGSRLRQKCQVTFGGALKTPTNVMSVETG